MSDVYICETSYHLLITLVKVLLRNDKSCKLVLLTGNVLDTAVINRLSKSGLFAEIKKYDNLHEIDGKLDYSAFFPVRGISLRKQLDSYLSWDYNSEDDYYLYNDVSIIGKWFNAHKIKYHLIEDGLDTYTLPTVHSNNYVESKSKRRIRQLFNAGFYCFGESKFTKSIEVNSASGLQFDTKGKNIVEVPRKQLFEKLSDEDKEQILSIYLSSEEKDALIKKLSGEEGNEEVQTASILLTQPIGFDKMASYDIHKKFYKDIVDKYAEGKLIIKPHPRDDVDYSELFPDAIVIDKGYLPVETLGFFKDVKFKKAITWCSTSIKGLQFCDEKVYLGIEYIKPYLEMDKDFDSKWLMARQLMK